MGTENLFFTDDCVGLQKSTYSLNFLFYKCSEWIKAGGLISELSVESTNPDDGVDSCSPPLSVDTTW